MNLPFIYIINDFLILKLMSFWSLIMKKLISFKNGQVNFYWKKISKFNRIKD